MQIIADITHYPVYTIVQEVEAALGAALLAAHAVGLVDDRQMEKGWVQLELRAEPEVGNTQAYDHSFANYLELYPVLKSLMHSL
jgi:xylulokinase